MSKAAVKRQVIVTWYKPEEKLPEEDRLVIVTFSGSFASGFYAHTFGIARCAYSEFPDLPPAWEIEGIPHCESMNAKIEAWADLEPYGCDDCDSVSSFCNDVDNLITEMIRTEDLRTRDE